MAVEKITLNLIPTGETPTIHAAQFDKERSFQIELKEGEDDFSPTGYDIELQVRKVDNNIVTAVPSQTSGNIVTFLTTEQMTACSGTNLAELQISKNNMSIATLHFYLVVQRDVLAGGLSSQSEIYDLEEQIAAILPEVIGDEYYTADQVDEKIAEIPTFDPSNYYDKTQLYTKTETNGLLSQKANTSALSTVAFTGSYDDLVDHPVIPDVSDYYKKSETYSQAEVNTLLSTKADTSSLSSVATSGSYDDLTDKPTIPGNATELPITSGSAVNTKEYIDTKTTLVKSASGSLVHISDGGDNIPLKACEVTIDPDLSGKTECNLVVTPDNLVPLFNADNNFRGKVNFNQFVVNGTFTSTSNWVYNRATLAAVNNIGRLSNFTSSNPFIMTNPASQFKANHKFIGLFYARCDTTCYVEFSLRASYDRKAYKGFNIDNTMRLYGCCLSLIDNCDRVLIDSNYVNYNSNSVIEYSNVMLFDITSMFGDTIADYIYNLEQSETGAGIALFKSIYPNDYYAYNSGTNELVGAREGTTYNIPFGQTVTAGGTLDVISGKLVVGGVTTQLTPVSPKTISGENNIYNDCGATDIEYFTSSADGLAALIEVLSNS